MKAPELLARIRVNGAIPRHVAIIMDGNGRWARERNLPRPLGHCSGMKSVREVVEGAIEAGIEVLSLFAFSQENWQRPATEIQALMSLLEEYIAREADELRRRACACGCSAISRASRRRRPRGGAADGAHGGQRPPARSTSSSRTAVARRSCAPRSSSPKRCAPAG